MILDENEDILVLAYCSVSKRGYLSISSDWKKIWCSQLSSYVKLYSRCLMCNSEYRAMQSIRANKEIDKRLKYIFHICYSYHCESKITNTVIILINFQIPFQRDHAIERTILKFIKNAS